MDNEGNKEREREDEADEMGEGLINIVFIHGGRFLDKNCYVAGMKEVVDGVDWTTLEFHEVERYVKSLGYHSVLKYAFRQLREVEGYTLFHDAHSYEMFFGDHIDYSKNLLKLYVECLDADLSTLGGDSEGKYMCDNSGGDEGQSMITMVGVIRAKTRVRLRLKVRVRVRVRIHQMI